MTQAELEAFRQAIKTVRAKYGTSRESALKLLMQEGVVNADGKLTARYAASADYLRRKKKEKAA